jgi:hypothetical protein
MDGRRQFLRRRGLAARSAFLRLRQYREAEDNLPAFYRMVVDTKKSSSPLWNIAETYATSRDREHIMNWHLAVEKNHEALRRILSMLVAIIGVAGNNRPATLPRHLHRFMLRLLRPAESATRRLIIVAARGLVGKLPKRHEPKPQPGKPSLSHTHTLGLGIAMRPGAFPIPAKARLPMRLPALSLSLLDPMKRFGARRRKYAKPAVLPRIGLIGDPYSPFLQPPPAPVAPTPDDPLDARRIHHRLDAIARALDDLPGQALRMARWQARRDARLAAERSSSVPGGSDEHFSKRAIRGVNGNTTAPPKRSFQRFLPLRPGRPPGWRRKPDHDVYDVLNELHGLAVWANEGRDTS